MKVLNIDALVTPKRVLTLAGERHPVKELSAQQFVDSLAKSEKLEAEGKTMKDSEVFRENVDLVLELVPTIKREVLMPLPLAAVITILKFCRGDDDGIVTTEDDAGNAQPT